MRLNVVCQTCTHYHQNGFDCAHYGDFGDIEMKPCYYWVEGSSHENLLYRIMILEQKLMEYEGK
jgi:hypothetical protein